MAEKHPTGSRTIGRSASSGKFTDARGADIRVVRTLTMPDGSAKRVMRDDAFKRALSPASQIKTGKKDGKP